MRHYQRFRRRLLEYMNS